jgi:hypothetical protein
MTEMINVIQHSVEFEKTTPEVEKWRELYWEPLQAYLSSKSAK